jgi:TM2 domain-containing membrane protein YozV
MLRSPHQIILLALTALYAAGAAYEAGLYLEHELISAGAALGLFLVLWRWRGSNLLALAALLLFGGWGIHRFYLGYRRSGWIMFAVLSVGLTALTYRFHRYGFYGTQTVGNPLSELPAELFRTSLAFGAPQILELPLWIVTLSATVINPMAVLGLFSGTPRGQLEGLAMASLVTIIAWLIADFFWLCWRLLRRLWAPASRKATPGPGLPGEAS